MTACNVGELNASSYSTLHILTVKQVRDQVHSTLSDLLYLQSICRPFACAHAQWPPFYQHLGLGHRRYRLTMDSCLDLIEVCQSCFAD